MIQCYVLVLRYLDQVLGHLQEVCVRFLARIQERDNITVLGRTLESLMTECDMPPSRLNELTAPLVRKKCCYLSVPDAEVWRIPMLVELIKVRDKWHL